MIQLQKILVAVDFSEHSNVAFTYAAEFAKMFDAEVLLCHVVGHADLLSQLPPDGEAYFPPNITELQIEHAQGECERQLAESGIARGRVLVEVGTPFVEFYVTRKEDVDLVIVGTHGRGAVAHMLLGSVAEKVVRKAPCPVLTVRQGEHDFTMP